MRLPVLLLIASLASAAEPTPATTANAWLGVGLAEVDDAVAYHLGLEADLGVMIEQVVPGGPAAGMGLKVFDVVVAVDGVAVYTPRALQQMVGKHGVGDTLAIQVRRGAETVTVTGALGSRPADEEVVRTHCGVPFHPGQRRGTVPQPDGSVMEWSVEDEPTK
jgi:S1-C subfamily serine protease